MTSCAIARESMTTRVFAQNHWSDHSCLCSTSGRSICALCFSIYNCRWCNYPLRVTQTIVYRSTVQSCCLGHLVIKVTLQMLISQYCWQAYIFVNQPCGTWTKQQFCAFLCYYPFDKRHQICLHHKVYYAKRHLPALLYCKVYTLVKLKSKSFNHSNPTL